MFLPVETANIFKSGSSGRSTEIRDQQLQINRHGQLHVGQECRHGPSIWRRILTFHSWFCFRIWVVFVTFASFSRTSYRTQVSSLWVMCEGQMLGGSRMRECGVFCCVLSSLVALTWSWPKLIFVFISNMTILFVSVCRAAVCRIELCDTFGTKYLFCHSFCGSMNRNVLKTKCLWSRHLLQCKNQNNPFETKQRHRGRAVMHKSLDQCINDFWGGVEGFWCCPWRNDGSDSQRPLSLLKLAA